MPVPVHELATTEQYLVVLDGHPAKFAPGTAFSYCNGGFVVLALIAERASGVPFHDLVQQRVCEPGRTEQHGLPAHGRPAGTRSIGLRRSRRRGAQQRVPSSCAREWRRRRSTRRSATFDCSGRRSSPDASFPRAGSPRWSGHAVSSRTTRATASGSGSPGSGDAVRLEGYDAGVFLRSWHHPSSSLTYTVVSNRSAGVWPLARALRERLSN